MPSPKCVHICSEDVKFIVPFMALVRENFNAASHKFLFLSPEGRELLETQENAANISSPPDIFKHIGAIYRADKIILHAMMSRKLIMFLALQPWLLKKCYWVIWGRDLYAYKNQHTGWKTKLNEALRSFVIKHLGHIVTFIEGDFKLAQTWYKTRAKYHRSFVYKSNVFKDLGKETQPHTGLNILLGNSAHAENNHDQAFEALAAHKDTDIKIYTPLTYGDEEYKNGIIAQGQAMFGDKYTPMTEFMLFDRYVAFLNTVDIAIFAHDRQQAMGNIISLSGMGKTIYLKDNHTLFETFTGLGLKFFNFSDLDLKLLNDADRKNNAALIKQLFSEEALLKSLNWMTD